MLFTKKNRRLTISLWIVQALLALLFLFAGSMKLVLPIEEMTKQIQLPGLFLRLIGIAEVIGALGLILPGLLRIQPRLTRLAAAGLVIIMIGATVLTLITGGVTSALFPFTVGLFSAFVAYGRGILMREEVLIRGRLESAGVVPLQDTPRIQEGSC